MAEVQSVAVRHLARYSCKGCDDAASQCKSRVCLDHTSAESGFKIQRVTLDKVSVCMASQGGRRTEPGVSGFSPGGGGRSGVRRVCVCAGQRYSREWPSAVLARENKGKRGFLWIQNVE